MADMPAPVAASTAPSRVSLEAALDTRRRSRQQIVIRVMTRG